MIPLAAVFGLSFEMHFAINIPNIARFFIKIEKHFLHFTI